MEEVRGLNEINEEIIANYKDMIVILKESIENRDRLIAMYEKQLLIQDKYIEGVNVNIELLKNIIL